MEPPVMRGHVPIVIKVSVNYGSDNKLDAIISRKHLHAVNSVNS